MAHRLGFALSMIIILKLNPECTGFQGKFYRSNSKALTSYNRTLSALSKIVCSFECARERSCRSASYRQTTGECMLSDLPAFYIDVYGNDDSFVEVFGKTEWLTVFRGIPGIGVNPLDAWLNGTGTTSDPTCRDTLGPSCDKHYRDPLVDYWAAIRLTEVKIVFYKGAVEKLITFNGVGSSISNWFDINRVLDSSWTTLVGKSYGYFSLEGDAGNGRRFFTTSHYSHCWADRIFTLVIAKKVAPCAFDLQSSYPQILFATGDDWGYPESMTGMVLADSFAIFIK